MSPGRHEIRRWVPQIAESNVLGVISNYGIASTCQTGFDYLRLGDDSVCAARTGGVGKKVKDTRTTAAHKPTFEPTYLCFSPWHAVQSISIWSCVAAPCPDSCTFSQSSTHRHIPAVYTHTQRQRYWIDPLPFLHPRTHTLVPLISWFDREAPIPFSDITTKTSARHNRRQPKTPPTSLRRP